MDLRCSVTLLGVDDLPAAERVFAELRFLKELEKSLGGAVEVVRVFRAWQDASESEASELSHESSNLAMKWPKAFDTAQRAGLKLIAEGDAHFEVGLKTLAAE